jgi:hypothetical protein
MLAAVFGEEELGLFFIAAAQSIGFGGAEGVDVAEVEAFGIGRIVFGPGLSGVRGEQDRAFAAASPDGSGIYRVDAAQAGALGGQPKSQKDLEMCLRRRSRAIWPVKARILGRSPRNWRSATCTLPASAKPT